MSESPIRRAQGYPQMFNRAVKSPPRTPADTQLAIIQRKVLLGDDEADRLATEHGTIVAQHHARLAASALKRCNCERSDGIICARNLDGGAGSKCWPCWARIKDGKPCNHNLGLVR